MSIPNILDDIELKDVKTHLIEIGIYEKGMLSQEMMDIYKIIKQSEKSANEERQYRTTIAATNKNESDLSEVLSENRNLRSATKISERVKKVTEEHVTEEHNNNLLNDSFFPTHETEKIVTSDFSDSDTTDDPTNKKETKTNLNSNKPDIITNYSKNNKNIDVFSNCESKGSLNIINKHYKNEDLPIYCRSDMKKLPNHLFVKAIMNYHDKVSSDTKKLQNQSINRVVWGKPIAVSVINKSKINNKNTDSPVLNTTKQTSTELDTSIHCLRSRRNVKRKSYTEYFSDDDKTVNKKIRDTSKLGASDQELSEFRQEFGYSSLHNKLFDYLRDTPDCQTSSVSKDIGSSDEEHSTQVEVMALVHNDNGDSPPAKRKCTAEDNGNVIATLSPGDIIELILDDETKQNKIDYHRDLDKIEIIEDNECIISSIEEDKFIPRRIPPPNPYREKFSTRTEQRIKNASKRRNKNPHSIVKPDSQKVIEDKVDEATDTYDITPKKFYGPKPNNIHSRLRSNSKQKSTLEEKESLCPICSKYFSSSIIEEHASNCLSPGKKDKNSYSLCNKCDAVVLDLEQHVCAQDKLIFEDKK